MTAMDSRPLFLKVIILFLILRFLFFIRTLGPGEVSLPADVPWGSFVTHAEMNA